MRRQIRRGSRGIYLPTQDGVPLFTASGYLYDDLAAILELRCSAETGTRWL